MAIVSITLSGEFNLGSVDSSNFIIENAYDGQFTTYSGNSVDTPEGIDLLKVYLATFFTSAMPNYPGGSVTTNEVTYDGDTRILNINLVGEGDNEAIYLPSCIMVNAAETNTNVIAFRYGTIAALEEGCTTCFTAKVDECEDVAILLDFEVDTEYTLVITDKFGDETREALTSNDEGTITLPKETVLALGSPLTINFYHESTGIHEFSINGKTYSCLILEFIAGGTNEAPDPLAYTATSI